jgi:hypothetical protein
MKIKDFSGAMKNKPNQSQTNSKRVGWGLYPTNSSRSEAEIPTGELLGILKPGTKQNLFQT